MELVVDTQIVLFAGHIVHGLPCLLASFVARRRYQPIFSHYCKLIIVAAVVTPIYLYVIEERKLDFPPKEKNNQRADARQKGTPPNW